MSRTETPTPYFPANLFKFNDRNTRKRCEICLKITVKTDVVLMFSLLTLNIFHTFFYVFLLLTSCYPANIYLFKVNNRNTRKRCEICSKLTIKAPDVFNDKFGDIPQLFLVFLSLTLNS